MSRLKICMLPLRFPFQSPGGIATLSYELSKAIVHLGHEVHAILQDDGNICRLDELSGIQLHYVRFPKFIRSGTAVHLYGLLALRKISDLSCGREFDIVHTYNLTSFVYALYRKLGSLKIPHIVHHADTSMSELSAYIKELIDGHTPVTLLPLLNNFLNPLLESFYIKNADSVIAEDYATRDKLIRMHGISLEKVNVIPSGIDLTRFSKPSKAGSSQRRLGLGQDFVVLYVGRLAPRKGVQYLIKAMKEVNRLMPRTKLLIVGKGPYEPVLRNLTISEKLDNSVIFTGYVDDEELPKYYGAADLCVIPSLSEGIPITLLEAMASAKPVVCTKLDGIIRFLGKEGRELVSFIDPTDTHALALAIIHIFKNLNYESKKAKNRRKFIQHHTWKNVAERVIKVYTQVINRQSE